MVVNVAMSSIRGLRWGVCLFSLVSDSKAINPNPKTVHPPNPLIDTRCPFSSSATTSSSAAKPSNHLSITELNDVVHLFRSQSPSSTTSLTSPSARSTKLFGVAIPNYLSPDNFLLFYGSHVDHFSELYFLWLRSVIYILLNQRRAVSWQKKPVHLCLNSLNCLLALFVLAYGINHLVRPTRDYLFAPSLSDICQAVDFIHVISNRALNLYGGMCYIHFQTATKVFSDESSLYFIPTPDEALLGLDPIMLAKQAELFPFDWFQTEHSLPFLIYQPQWILELRMAIEDYVLETSQPSYSAYSHARSEVKGLLVAFSHLSFDTLHDEIPHKNFLWCCDVVIRRHFLNFTALTETETFLHYPLSLLN
ncbi:hypothetical protein ACSBR1_039422 [Camellia fascicularis]